MRRAAREIRGAVDRIDHPDRRAFMPDAALALLADEAVLGKQAVQARRDQALDLAVDLGQVVLRSLEADSERAAVDEPPPGDLRRPRARARRRRGNGRPGRGRRMVTACPQVSEMAECAAPERRPAPVAADEFAAAPTPATASPTQVAADARRERRRLECTARPTERRRRAVHNRRRPSRQSRRAPGRRRSPPRAAGESGRLRNSMRAETPLTRNIFVRSPTKPSETSMPPCACAAIAARSARRGRGSR